MSDVEPYGTMPTPYGTLVEVSRRRGAAPGADDEFVFSADASMAMAGLHDAAALAQCRKLIRQRPQDILQIIFSHGGQPVPRVPLPHPTTPIYAALPDDVGDGDTSDDGVSIRGVVDLWITKAADAVRWHERSKVLLELCHGQLEVWAPGSKSASGFALCQILTAVLENLGEREIDCLEAAAFYVLTRHREWRVPARTWLLPHRHTWHADWVRERPGYRRLARLIRPLFDDVPGWVAGGGA